MLDICCKVIIEPYWNWNNKYTTVSEEKIRYNWTLLELKWISVLSYSFLCRSYNWTLLELKFWCWWYAALSHYVIIEPYWNWNTWRTSWSTARQSYNWTLLELKSLCQVWKGFIVKVIIEPYWNWNQWICAI